MSVREFPEGLFPSTMELNLEFNNLVFTSPATNKEQFQRRAGERWVLRFTYADLEQDEAKDLQGFLLGLEGVLGQFRIPDFAFYTRGGGITGQPVVDGSSNQGNLCNIRNCPANRLLFVRGDYVKIGSRLHMLREEVRSDSQGRATLNFVPRMLSIPNDGMNVVYDDFSIICRLKDDKQGKRASRDMVNNFSFEAVEVF